MPNIFDEIMLGRVQAAELEVLQLQAAALAATPEPLPAFMDEKQAAKALGLSVTTVKKILADGRLPAIDAGNGKKHLWRIAAADLMSFAKPQPQSQQQQDQAPTSDSTPTSDALATEPKQSRRRPASTSHLPPV